MDLDLTGVTAASILGGDRRSIGTTEGREHCMIEVAFPNCNVHLSRSEMATQC
jgi:hypothetical protein